jgi:hypothetical protein
MVAAAIRTVFAQPDAEHVHEQLETIAMMLGRQLPKVEQMMREAKDDLLAFNGFPQQHWRKIWSTNPLERVNREVKRRTEVVGVFLRGSLRSAAELSGFAATLGEEPRVTRNLSVRPPGLDLVRASLLGTSGRWSRDLRAAC